MQACTLVRDLRECTRTLVRLHSQVRNCMVYALRGIGIVQVLSKEITELERLGFYWCNHLLYILVPTNHRAIGSIGIAQIIIASLSII